MSCVSERQVLAERVHKYAPPPWRMYEALVHEARKWLVLRPGEVDPEIVEVTRPHRVVWSSLWPVSASDTIEFTIEPFEAGTALQFRWLSDSPPDDRGLGLVRHRLNEGFGAHLREFVDTEQPLRE